MFKRTRIVFAGVALVFGLPVYADCDLPMDIEIPDGSTASTENMLAGQTRVKEYMATMEEYLDCLDHEEKAIPEKQTPEAKELHLQLHNTAVDQMEAVAAQFNEQIRAYKKVN